MRLFRSYSIRTKIYLNTLLLTGCALQTGGIYKQAELEPFEEIKTYVTPHEKTLDAIVGRGDPMSADPRRVFDHYCANGRNQRPLETTIRAVLPRLPKGVALDVASSAQQDIYKYFRNLVKNYYNQSLYEDTLGNKKLPNSNVVFAIKEPTLDGITSLAKDTRANDKTPLTLLSINGHNTLLLGMMKLPTYARSYYSGSENGLFQWRESQGEPALGSALDVIFPKRPILDDRGQQIYPVYPALPFEIIFLQKYFTMLIPKETQQQMFGDDEFFLHKDGSFDLGAATQRRASIWNAYVASQTSLKEAQTDDPQIIDFQVKLDLNLFCRYGRIVSDLLTD